jgi:hypothetical protein
MLSVSRKLFSTEEVYRRQCKSLELSAKHQNLVSRLYQKQARVKYNLQRQIRHWCLSWLALTSVSEEESMRSDRPDLYAAV